MTVLRSYAMLLRGWRQVQRRLGVTASSESASFMQKRKRFYDDMWRAAAADCGLMVRQISEDILEFHDNGKFVTRVSGYLTMLDDPVTLMVAGDKALTYRLLSDADLAIPAYETFTLDSLDRLRLFIAGHQEPFVVKPVRGTSTGLGITTNVRTFMEAVRAASVAAVYCSDILIERYVVGESYRLLFVSGEMIRASRRAGVRVVGDGKRSIAQLIDQKVADHRGGIESKTWADNSDLKLTSGAQGYAEDTVPNAGETVLVTSRPFGVDSYKELRTVYTEDVTELVCDSIIDDARSACRAVRSEFAGVDIITIDAAAPLAETGGAIVEVNTTPGLQHHYDLDHIGAAAPAATTVLRHLIKNRHS